MRPEPMPVEVTVLGAGIIGICTALSLAQRGARVRLIDRSAPGQETSFGNAGVISPWSIVPQSQPGLWRQIPRLMFGRYRPLSVRAASWPKMLGWGTRYLRNGSLDKVQATSAAMEMLCGPSVDLYRKHLEGTGAEGLLVDAMYIHAFRNPAGASLSSLGYAMRQERGAEIEVLGYHALHRLEPALSPEFQAAVVIKGQARARNPGRIAEVLTQKAQNLGVEVLHHEVHALSRTPEGWQITCRGTQLRADNVIVSMGVWSAELLRSLGYRFPLMAERGYHVEFPDPGLEMAHSVMDVDAACIASSMEGGVRFAGQAEFAPIDAPVDPRRKAHLTRLAKAAFPALNTHNPRFWMGRRPSLPDGLPALGPMPHEKGLFVNFGHCHFGLMMAPKSGELLANIVTQTPSNQDLSAFSPARF
ncbi:MAG: FAD-dependent oxidoreductase [Pseudomonadota bacterium]